MRDIRELRDIRPDIRERLAENAARQREEIAEFEQKYKALEKAHKGTLDALGRERLALEQLLECENERHGIPALTLAQKLAVRVPLSDFLVAKVQAHGPMNKDELRAEAKLAGYLATGNGRRLHITLTNVRKNGRLRLLSDGRFAFQIIDQPTEGKMQTLM